MDYESLTEKLLKSNKEKFFVNVVPVTEKGEVLLGKRSEDEIWTTPGGGAEPNEEPHEAARRELFEEAGLAVSPNSLELVSVGETPKGFKFYSFLWRMPSVLGEVATSKLDPDKEVKSWKLYRPEDFPASIQSEQNASRLKTIREALMRLYAIKAEEDSNVFSLINKLNKGGPGSGVQGHVTAKKPSPLHPHVAAAPKKPINEIQAHLRMLEHGGALPGVKTKSGKPVVTDMDAARAHGYDVQDHVDAMNAHYDKAQKVQAMLEKFKMAGHAPPEEGAKIARFHEKKMKEHMRAREYLENRKTHTEAALKEAKKKASESTKKSITQMGSGLGDRDLDVGSFAQANGQGNAEWMEKLYQGMEGFEYGADPREFKTDKGILHLARVDDGLYTGYFTKNEEGLADNAKIRIERITVPELVQLMIAKEWIPNHMLEQDPPPQVGIPDVNHAEEVQLMNLNSSLLAESAATTQSAPSMDQKIKLLELVSKLLS